MNIWSTYTDNCDLIDPFPNFLQILSSFYTLEQRPFFEDFSKLNQLFNQHLSETLQNDTEKVCK